MLADKTLAISFLREYLPSGITDLICFDTLAYPNTSYISEELRSSFSDMVWEVETTSRNKVYICLLLEHKSYIYPKVVFQVLGYLASGYSKQVAGKEPPGLIVPILYYHGKRKWKLKPFEAYFTEFPETLWKYLPAYEMVFVNLEQISEEQIQNLKNGLLRSVIMTQKHYFNLEALNRSMLQILDNLNPYWNQDWLTLYLFTYCKTAILIINFSGKASKRSRQN